MYTQKILSKAHASFAILSRKLFQIGHMFTCFFITINIISHINFFLELSYTS